MSTSNRVDESTTIEDHKPDIIEDADTTTDDHQNSEQIDYSEYQKKLEEYFEHALHKHRLLIRKLKSLISKLSADSLFDLIKPIYEFKIKSDKIEKTAKIIQKQFKDQKDSIEQSTAMTNGLNSDHNNDLETNIQRLRKKIDEQKLNLEEINNCSEQRRADEEVQIYDEDDQSDNVSNSRESTVSSLMLPKEKNHLRLNTNIARDSESRKSDENSTLSRLLLRQMSPAIIDQYGNERNSVENEEVQDIYPADEIDDENDDEIIEGELVEVTDSNTTPRINGKVHLANGIVSMMKGPFKIVVDGTMHAVELCAKETEARHTVIQAVQQGLERQKKVEIQQQTSNTTFKPAFTEVTSDWIFEGENTDKGFSSASVWMRNPDGRRVLIKIQDLPICAANEWLAYVLGRQIGLPVNEVQIAIYKKNLASLHTDVSREDDNTIAFMDLPRRLRKTLMTDPLMERMDVFDHIIQNVDRNPRNILVTIPKTTNIEDDNVKLKIHLIDHGACFGMGKLNGISVMASKLRTHHLSIVKFDPAEQAKKFEQYLIKLPTSDRFLIRNTLNAFALIADEQIDNWMTEIQDLLTPAQYNRIHDVLYRQRDIVRRYTVQWGISPKSSSINSNQTDQSTPDTTDMMTSF